MIILLSRFLTPFIATVWLTLPAQGAVDLSRYETCIKDNLASSADQFIGRTVNEYINGVSASCRDTLRSYKYSRRFQDKIEAGVNARVKAQFLRQLAARSQTKPDDTAYRAAAAAGTAEAWREFLNENANDFYHGLALGQLTKLATKDRALRKEMVLQLQTELNRVGCSVGTADGLWGRNSRKGLNAFADKAGITLTSTNPSFGLVTLVENHTTSVCE